MRVAKFVWSLGVWDIENWVVMRPMNSTNQSLGPTSKKKKGKPQYLRVVQVSTSLDVTGSFMPFPSICAVSIFATHSSGLRAFRNLIQCRASSFVSFEPLALVVSGKLDTLSWFLQPNTQHQSTAPRPHTAAQRSCTRSLSNRVDSRLEFAQYRGP